MTECSTPAVKKICAPFVRVEYAKTTHDSRDNRIKVISDGFTNVDNTEFTMWYIYWRSKVLNQ